MSASNVLKGVAGGAIFVGTVYFSYKKGKESGYSLMDDLIKKGEVVVNKFTKDGKEEWKCEGDKPFRTVPLETWLNDSPIGRRFREAYKGVEMKVDLKDHFSGFWITDLKNRAEIPTGTSKYINSENDQRGIIKKDKHGIVAVYTAQDEHGWWYLGYQATESYEGRFPGVLTLDSLEAFLKGVY